MFAWTWIHRPEPVHFLHDCTVGSHLLAQNLSTSSNLDFRHEQMNSSVFCFLWVFIFCFVLLWGFFVLFVCLGFWGGSGFGVFKKGGVISGIKRQKQNSVLQEQHTEVFCCRGTALCMHCWMVLSEFAVSVEKGGRGMGRVGDRGDGWVSPPCPVLVPCALSHNCSRLCYEGDAYSKGTFVTPQQLLVFN